MRELLAQDLHYIAMNHIGNILTELGFEFIAINSQLKKHPQFVCVNKHNQLHFVLVKYVLYPDNPQEYDSIFVETFINHAKTKNAKVWYAGVGLANANNIDLPIYEGEEYLIQFIDFEKFN
jgi:hypothetical protein